MAALWKIPPGKACRVLTVAGKDEIHTRLMEMGIIPGTQIYVVRVAPVGKTMQVRLRDYQLLLRRKEAEKILVAAQ